MTPEEFRRHGHAVIDWIADYRESVATRPVMSRSTPGDIRRELPAEPPLHPERFEQLLGDLDTVIVPGLSHWAHPQFAGYFPSNSDLASVLGDYVSSGLGVLGLTWSASPALSELEEVVTDWMRQMVGLSDAWRGVIQDTASTGTVVALVSARERTTNFSRDRGGLQSEARPLVVYVSDQAHSSVEKAALLAGFGADNVRRIPHDADGAMDVAALTVALDADRAAHRRPCALVATTGTTATTALDPVQALADLARQHDLWLHVDAALAGSAMILPDCRWMWNGIEGADSLVLNPHKWLGAVFDCSTYYVRDSQHLVRALSAGASYLRGGQDESTTNYRDWGIALGRRFRALKLWFLIRHHGVEALQERIRRDMAHARWLDSEVRATTGWRVLFPVVLQTVCVRHEPDGIQGDALDRHTLAWVARVNQSGDAYLTPARVDGRWFVRVSLGGISTEREHVERIWRVMQREAHLTLEAG